MINKNLRELKLDGKKESKIIASVVTTGVVAIGAGCLMGSTSFATEGQIKAPEIASIQISEDEILGDFIEVNNGDSSEVNHKDSRITLKDLFGKSSDKEDSDSVDEEPSWLEETMDLIFGGLKVEEKQIEVVEYTEVNPEEFISLYTPKAKTVEKSEKTASDSSVKKKTRKEFVKVAKSYLNQGIKYKWKGKRKETKGLDCSGYVSSVLNEMGVNVNKFYTNAKKFSNDSTKVKREDLKVGDLVFWNDLTGKKHSDVYHIGFYLGDNTVIDCSTDHDGMGTRKLSSLQDKAGVRFFTFGRYEELEKVFGAND